MKANSVLPVEEDYWDGPQLSTIDASSKPRAKKTEDIRGRVIEYGVTATTDNGEEEVSSFQRITSILDPVTAPAQNLAGPHARRWKNESSFDELETLQCGPHVVLRSNTADGVLQEIYGYLCAHYALRSLIGTVAKEFYEDPLNFSFTDSLRAARRSLVSRPAFPPQKLTETFIVFCLEILHQLLPQRRNRTVPRAVKRKMPKWKLKRLPKNK